MTTAKSIRASVAWSAARNWGVRLSSILLFFVLARILPLDQLGLFSAATAIVAIAELFAENGIGDAVVQAEKVDNAALSAALFINVLMALGCVVALIAAAPWLETVFAAPGLTPVLSLAALAIMMNAFSYIPQSLLRRRMEFRWLAARALFASLVSGVVGIVLAVLGFGVTALIAQFLLAAFINMAFVWWMRPFTPQIAPLRAAWPLTRFGANVFGTRVLDYIAGRAVELAVLAGLGPAALALYILASRLWSVLMQLISAVTIDVSLPVFARLAQDRNKLLESFYSAIRMTFAVGVPIFVMVAALAPEIMPVIFGRNGRGGAVLLTPLALLGAVQIVQFYNGVLLTAIGRPKDTMLVNLIRAVVVAIILAVTFGQPLPVVVILFAIGHMLMTPVYFWYGKRRVGLSIARTFRIGAPFLIAAAAMFIVIWISRPFLLQPVQLAWLRGGVLAAAGAMTYAAVALAVGGASVRHVIADVFGRRAKPRLGTDTDG